jgi:hypothetical protein
VKSEITLTIEVEHDTNLPFDSEKWAQSVVIDTTEAIFPDAAPIAVRTPNPRMFEQPAGLVRVYLRSAFIYHTEIVAE